MVYGLKMGFLLTQQLYLVGTPFLQPPLVNRFLSEDLSYRLFPPFAHRVGAVTWVAVCCGVVSVALSLWSWAIFPRLVFF